MKRVVSISLGSSKRDKKVEVEILGEKFILERIGTDGSKEKMINLFKELDGKVDAFGLGGADLYISVGKKRTTLKSIENLIKEVKITPVCDGQYLKDTLEKNAVLFMRDKGLIDKNTKVMVISGVSRYGQVEGFLEVGCKILFGDLMFSLNLPFPIYNHSTFLFLASIIVPIARNLPYEWLYPTGKSQEEIIPKYEKYYKWADVIAGDFLYIKKHMPEDLKGKIIFTNTTTLEDRELLKNRGVKYLVTTTPEFDGRTFGTNVMEALICAYVGKKPNEIKESEYYELMERLNIKPNIIEL
ncbi:MAG: quinate 5-dehydrogenase [Caldisericia bacterium]|nr:quinate 5-dehydrogenase [Caldisericia bacterium]